MATLQKITPHLWFDKQAAEATAFYTSIFKNSKLGKVSHYSKEGKEIHKMPPGSVMTVEFWIEDQRFLALNGGPVFKFNEAVSFIVNCDTQQEIDYYWEKLSAGGDEKAQQCGWLKDKFGVSWQIVPAVLSDIMHSPKAANAIRVFMKMKKIDIEALMDAFNK
jgi:predicted 3-demethylubiquinone-9 3-methyltransferase (glyoxalase superfamily)